MEKNTFSKPRRQVTRRDFIKGFGGGALGAAVVPRLWTQDSDTLATGSGDVQVFTTKQVAFSLNGRSVSLVVEPRDTLLDVLRERYNLTGTKKVCDRGECGGCTVLMDGKPIYACMFPAVRVQGANITTIEGLATQDNLHPVQQAFIEKDAYQCGFCTPGFIMTSAAFLSQNQEPTLAETQAALSGNLCRCGNYVKIFEAVDSAAKKIRGA
jgi:aerobic-type carbon monoxide dehydrogenase small subunit (CoxS/CutS family)